MKLFPKNFMYFVTHALLPFRWRKTYIEVMGDEITLSRYFASEGKVKRTISNFRVNEIIQIGFPIDFQRKGIEQVIVSRYGAYVSQEVLFIMENEVVSWNVRPYTKRQVRALMEMLQETNRNIVFGKRFTRVLGLKERRKCN